MKISIPEGVTRTVSMTILKSQKHSPTILFAAGVVGVVATTITACKATLKLEGILISAEKDKSTAAEVMRLHRDDYTEMDYKKDMTVLYIRHASHVCKLYAPTVILGALSIAALTGSHKILTSRNAGLTAAYAAVDQAFKEYRQRVTDEYGEEKDRELRHGVETKTITVEGKDGSKKQKVKVHGGASSMYSQFFTPGNSNWCPQPEYNIAFLRLKQNWLNDRLRAKGHVFLNEAYEELGFKHTPAGSQVGWLWDKGTGDNFIDFGIWADQSMGRFHDYVTGREDEILLDFNVDGEIWKMI